MLAVRKLIFSARSNVAMAIQPATMYTTPIIGDKSSRGPTLEEKLGLPQKPKKPLPPFFTYSIKAIQEIRKMNVDKPISITERMRISRELWDKVDKEEKVRLHKQFVDDLAKYNLAKDQYLKSLSEEDRQRLQAARQERRILKKTRAEKKQSNKPQSPSSPYVLFLREKYAQTKYNSLHAREFGEEWRNLKPEQKAKYESMHEKAKKEYEKELNEWEAQMIREGRPHLVRASMLPKTAKVSKSSTMKTTQKAPSAPPSID